MNPSKKQLLPHVELFVTYGVGGYVTLGKHIKYTFSDKTASYRESYTEMTDQCVERAQLIFTLDDNETVTTNGHSAKAGIIKADLRSLLGRSP